MELTRWMDDNLLTQGYRTTAEERHRLAFDLCLPSLAFEAADRYRRGRRPLPT